MTVQKMLWTHSVECNAIKYDVILRVLDQCMAEGLKGHAYCRCREVASAAGSMPSATHATAISGTDAGSGKWRGRAGMAQHLHIAFETQHLHCKFTPVICTSDAKSAGQTAHKHVFGEASAKRVAGNPHNATQCHATNAGLPAAMHDVRTCLSRCSWTAGASGRSAARRGPTCRASSPAR